MSDIDQVTVPAPDDDPGLDPDREYDQEPTWSADAVHEEADADPDDPFVMADAEEGDPEALERRERLRREMRERGVL